LSFIILLKNSRKETQRFCVYGVKTFQNQLTLKGNLRMFLPHEVTYMVCKLRGINQMSIHLGNATTVSAVNLFHVQLFSQALKRVSQ